MTTEEASGSELKAIIDILDNDVWFDEHMLATARWISEYYLCNLVDAMRLFIPGKSGVKSVNTYRMADDLDVNYILGRLGAKSATYCQVFMYINKYPGITSAKLEKQFGVNVLKIVRYLVSKDVIIGEAVVTKTATHRYKNSIRLAITHEDAKGLIESFTRKPAQCRLFRVFTST